jgi:hypothetical protein
VVTEARRHEVLVANPLSLPSAWTNKLITAKDHASVQINVGHLDADGVYNNNFTTYAFSGAVRQRVRSWEGAGEVFEEAGGRDV